MPAYQRAVTTKARPLLRRGLRLLLILTLSVLLLAAGLTSYVFSNPERIKFALENLLTRVTDRPFRIQGDFNIEFGNEIDIRATQVVWENPPWSTTANMMEIGSIELQVNLVSLIKHPVIITTSKAENARLEFEWNNNHILNWNFFADEPDDGDDTPLEAIPLLLNQASLNNVQLVFKAPLLPEPLVWNIEHAKQQQDQNHRLVISAETELDSRRLILQGRIGPFPELIVAGNVNAAARVQGPLQNLQFTADTDRLLTLDDLDFDLRWDVPDIAIVLDMLNLPENATSGPIGLKAFLKTEAGKVTAKIDGDIGEFVIDGSLQAPELNVLTDLHAKLDSHGPSARGFGLLFGIRDLPIKPYKFSFKADSIDKGLEISNLHFATADAELKGSGLLPHPPTLIDGDIQLDIKGKNLAEFQGLTNEVQFFEAPFTADIDLVGNGAGKPDTLTSKLTLGGMTGDINAKLAEIADYSGSKIDYSLIFPNSQRLLGMFDLAVTTTEPMKVNGRAEILKTGIKTNDLSIRIDDNKLLLNGLIAYVSSGEATRFTTQTEGPSFNGLMRYYLPFDLGPSLPYSAKGEIVIQNNMLTSKTKGKAGTTNLQFDSTVNMQGAGTDMGFKIVASGTSLDEWLQDFIQDERTNAAFKASADLNLTDDSLSAKNIDLTIRDARLQGSIAHEITKENDSFTFDLSASGGNLADELPKFTAYEPASVPFKFDVKGDFETTNITIDRMQGTIGGAELSVKGGIGLPPTTKAETLTIEASGDKLSDLGRLEGWEVEDAPFNIQATLNSEDEKLSAEDLSLKIGNTDLRGGLSADFTGNKPSFDISLTSRNISVGEILAKEQVELVDTMIDGEDETQAGERVIPDVELPVDLLDKLDGRLRLSADTIRRKDEKLSNLLIDASLKDGSLSLRKLTADTTFGNISSTLNFSPKNDTYSLEFGLTADNVRLPGTKEQEKDPGKFTGYDIDTWISGTGIDSKDITATLDGYVWIRGGKRQIENIKYKSLFGDAFTEIGVIINPFYKKDPYTNIQCEAFLLEIENGIMETSPVAFVKTDKLNMTGVGSINLNTERIRIGIESSPRKGIGISASDLLTPFVRVGGTMSKPKPEIDPKGSLIEGGAAVYTAGLSIVAKSLYQRWIKADKNCADYVALARSARQERDPEHVPAD